MAAARRLLVLLAAAVVLAVPAHASAAVGDCAPAAGWGTVDRDAAAQVLDLVNRHRAELGLTPLAPLAPLTAAAEWKSLHMAGYGYMEHDDPGPPVARSVGDRLAACGYSGGGWGENIAYGYPSAAAVMDGWLHSPGHKANIENPSYRSIGIGVARSARGVLYWTQDFGTTPSSAPAPVAASKARATATAALHWHALRGASTYRVYRGSAAVGSTHATSFALRDLACGTVFGVTVVGLRADGARVGAVRFTVRTSSC